MVAWWIYFVVAGIVYCGYQLIDSIMQERASQNALIEEEGKWVMDRVHTEKKIRKNKRQYEKSNS